jgi:dihydrodipicolinate synthase/N-acetylneuraminate lyase
MAISNVVPKLCVELVGAARKADQPRTQELQSLVDRLVAVTKSGPGISTLKFLVAQLRDQELGYRAPYEPLTPAEQSAVLAELAPIRPPLTPFLGK